MLAKTPAIALRFVKYGETSIIATLYTQEFGLTSYIVNGVRSTKSKGKIAFFQPLSLIDLVVYFKEGRAINRVSEVKSIDPLNDIRTNIIKSCIGLFIVEILNKCIKEEIPNPALFHFLKDSILLLNNLPENFENFHLIFLLRLSRYLGFEPRSALELYADLKEIELKPAFENEEILDNLLSQGYESMIKFSLQERMQLLNDILNFYRVHIDLPHINSVEILHEILSD